MQNLPCFKTASKIAHPADEVIPTVMASVSKPRALEMVKPGYGVEGGTESWTCLGLVTSPVPESLIWFSLFRSRSCRTSQPLRVPSSNSWRRLEMCSTHPCFCPFRERWCQQGRNALRVSSFLEIPMASWKWWKCCLEENSQYLCIADRNRALPISCWHPPSLPLPSENLLL